MTQKLGTIATKRLLRRTAAELTSDITVLETTVEALDAVPALSFAVSESGVQSIFCDFGIALTANAGTLVVGAWTGTVETNGGGAGALTVSGVVSTTRRVAIGITGTPFQPDMQSVQSITLAYDAGTGNLLDAAGRAINSFTVTAVVPRQDNPNAEYLAMRNPQASQPATPSVGLVVWPKNDGTLHVLNSGGVDVELGAGGGGGTFKTATLAFGSTPVSDKTFSITDAAVSATSKVVASVAGFSGFARDMDEVMADPILVAVAPAAGALVARAIAMCGLVQGDYPLVYTIG